jgi:hypothetical protein
VKSGHGQDLQSDLDWLSYISSCRRATSTLSDEDVGPPSVAAPEPGKKLGNPGSRVTPVPIPSVRVLGVRPFGWIVVCLRRARSETNTVLHE